MLVGKHVRLRAIEKADIPRFVTWLNDSEVRLHLTISRFYSLTEEEQWYEKMLQAPSEEHPLAIDMRSDDDQWNHIGSIGFHQVEWINRSAEVGILIGEKSNWDKGFGQEALRLMIRNAFFVLNLNRVFLRVFETNLRGIRCYEKVGFIHEGCLRQAKYQEGRYISVLIMGILKSDWKDSG